MSTEVAGTGEVSYDSVVLSGFLSKADNFAEPYAFSKLFERVSTVKTPH